MAQKHHVASQMATGVRGGRRDFPQSAYSLAGSIGEPDRPPGQVFFNHPFWEGDRELSESPNWWKGTGGLLPGLQAPICTPMGTALAHSYQCGGSLSSHLSLRRNGEVAEPIRDSDEVSMYGWRGRTPRTLRRDTAIRHFRRQTMEDRWGVAGPRKEVSMAEIFCWKLSEFLRRQENAPLQEGTRVAELVRMYHAPGLDRRIQEQLEKELLKEWGWYE